ncbi:hypothetical protein SESBI_36567 [Sesbania bispinosa]|nr:hypothetical protein SESBI_36567 [Sesbania bispinosa]
MASYRATYEHHILPLQGEEFWTPSDQLPPIPPTKKKTPGRPKKMRRKDGNEGQRSVNNNKIKRKLGDFTCQVCGGTSVPDEIDLSQSQPPPLHPSPSKKYNKLLRPKLNIRGKGGNTQKMAAQSSPPPSSPTLNVEDANKASQFMPTPGIKPHIP